jgi:hypothetical protein
MKLKTFGLLLWVNKADPAPNGSRQVRAVVATTSQEKAAKSFRVSLHELANFGGETGNADEIRQAMSDPGTPFWKNENGDNKWHRLGGFAAPASTGKE